MPWRIWYKECENIEHPFKGKSKVLTLQGVFGIARITCVLGSSHSCICRIVTPAQILIKHLFLSASFMPGSVKMAIEPWGLQLEGKTEWNSYNNPRYGLFNSPQKCDIWHLCYFHIITTINLCIVSLKRLYQTSLGFLPRACDQKPVREQFLLTSAIECVVDSCTVTLSIQYIDSYGRSRNESSRNTI